MMSRWSAYDAANVPLHHTKAMDEEIARGDRCQFCTTKFRDKGDNEPRACLNCEPGGGKYPRKKKGKS
jgi:hypothetical protein